MYLTIGNLFGKVLQCLSQNSGSVFFFPTRCCSYCRDILRTSPIISNIKDQIYQSVCKIFFAIGARTVTSMMWCNLGHTSVHCSVPNFHPPPFLWWIPNPHPICCGADVGPLPRPCPLSSTQPTLTRCFMQIWAQPHESQISKWGLSRIITQMQLRQGGRR